MDVIARILNEVDGGRVLDVGTQEGHFVQVLKKNLLSYSEIVGIDIDKEAIETAKNNLENRYLRFLVMNAEKIKFENESFDTVNISASLHHIANIPRVLNEMKRVLKPRGHFMIVEMHSSGKTPAELTSVYLHQWIADVDSALGQLHNPILERQEFMRYMTALELSHLEYYDYTDRDSDPMETNRIKQLESLIASTKRRIERTNNHEELIKRGYELNQRLYEVGAQREPIIIVLGKK